MTAEPLALRLEREAIQRRLAAIERIYQARAAERARADVAAVWVGFAPDGRGLATYGGRTYRGEVLGGVSIPGGSTVNLRRTPNGNFLAW